MKHAPTHCYYPPPTTPHYDCDYDTAHHKRPYSHTTYVQPYPNKSIPLIKSELKTELSDNNQPPLPAITEAATTQIEPNLLNMLLCATIKEPRIHNAILGHDWNPKDVEHIKQSFTSLLQRGETEDSRIANSRLSPPEQNGQSTPETNSPNSTSSINTTGNSKEDSPTTPILFIADSEKYNNSMGAVIKEISGLEAYQYDAKRRILESEAKMKLSMLKLSCHLHQLIVDNAVNEKWKLDNEVV